MNGPFSSQSPKDEDKLLSVLFNYAAKFTSDKNAQTRLVEQVLRCVPDYIDEILTGSAPRGLFIIMLRLVKETPSAGRAKGEPEPLVQDVDVAPE